MQNVGGRQAQPAGGVFEDRAFGLGHAQFAGGDDGGEAIGDTDAAQIGVPVGQCRQGARGAEAVECRQGVGEELDAVAFDVKRFEGRLCVGGVLATGRQGALETDEALTGEIVRQMRVLACDLFTQRPHGVQRVGRRGARAMPLEVAVQCPFRAFNHRPDRPEGVVEIEAERADGRHPRIVTQAA